jgi:aminoethylphosphonate catabolism LysR family transcriptional regulator
MRYSQLRSFHAAALCGGFTAAAETLRISQPAVTSQIRALEASYGVELFHRRGRRVELTDMGRRLVDITHRLFLDEEEAAQLLSQGKELRVGRLRVGAVGPYHVTEMIAAFNARHPRIEVVMTLGNSREIAQSVLDYRADVAVLAHTAPDPRLLTIPYSRHPVVILVGRQHRFFRRKNIRIQELGDEPFVMREAGSTTRNALEAALRRARVRPNVVMEIGSREAIREAVARGIGLAGISEAALVPDPRLWAVSVSNAEIFTSAHVICLRERRKARLIREFLRVVDELLGKRRQIAADCQKHESGAGSLSNVEPA